MSIINDALKKARDMSITGKLSKDTASDTREKDASTSQQADLSKAIKKPATIKTNTHSLKSKLDPKFYAAIPVIIIVLGILIFSLYSGRQDTPYRPEDIKAQPPQPGNLHEQYAEREDKTAVLHNEDISGLALTGIVHGEGLPMAIINDSVYMEGDKVRGLSITKISKSSVLFEQDGKTIEIKVK
jgi:hypothetical protein